VQKRNRILAKFNYKDEEVYVYRTNPIDSDTDDDELNDGVEVKNYGTDPHAPDSDGDGLKDEREVHGWNIIVNEQRREQLVQPF